jgi:hypothetical protein
MNFVVACVGDPFHVVDKQGHTGHVLSVCFGILLEESPEEDSCLIHRLYGVIVSKFVTESDATRGRWSPIGNSVLHGIDAI